MKRTSRSVARGVNLSQAIDRDGNLADVMLSERRDMVIDQAVFRQAIVTTGQPPERVTTDGHTAYRRAVRGVRGEAVQYRTSRELNDLIKQEHRWIKQCYDPKRGSR